jgi:hypothetical protein
VFWMCEIRDYRLKACKPNTIQHHWEANQEWVERTWQTREIWWCIPSSKRVITPITLWLFNGVWWKITICHRYDPSILLSTGNACLFSSATSS